MEMYRYPTAQVMPVYHLDEMYTRGIDTFELHDRSYTTQTPRAIGIYNFSSNILAPAFPLA
jgi:hypothetical protein